MGLVEVRSPAFGLLVATLLLPDSLYVVLTSCNITPWRQLVITHTVFVT